MQLLLKENVEHLGSTGELVDVKPGYARNFLVPRGFAVQVTRKNKNSIEKQIEKYKVAEAKKLELVKEFAAKVTEVNCTIAVKADENDKLFGSVTPEEIAKAVKLGGVDIKPKQIKIPKAIRAIGVFDVKINLEMGVVADLKVWVVKE